ncbi:Nn.00g079650.m01.CDS01 [Neocucurbitaria sp. VM-36]
MVLYNWSGGEGGLQPGEINPRGWAQVDFDRELGKACTGYDLGCHCEKCLEEFRLDSRPILDKLQARHEAKIEQRKQSSQLLVSALAGADMTPICCSTPIAGLPPRITKLSNLFDVVTSEISSLPSIDWLETFASRLGSGQAEGEKWEGQLIWAAVSRHDFSAYASSWASVGLALEEYIPPSSYPSRNRAGHRAAFIDVGLGSSLGFFWALSLDWDTQISAAIVTSIAYWADMATGVDAPVGQLAEIFDVMPMLAQACATGKQDNLSPMKALAIEYLRTPTIPAFSGPLPSLKDVWLSRMADVGSRESCVLMTGCQAPFSNRQNTEDARCLVAWAVIHDLFDLPRDISSGNRVNAVLWALFFGFSGHEILGWLRETVTIASRRGTCAAKLLLCTALVHVANPRWSVNGLALSRLREWPNSPKASAKRGKVLPSFSEQEGSHIPPISIDTKKLANAAQISFAERALLKDRNRFLFKINNEAKARRLARSIVLGKAKVMSFEDLEEAKARRAAKEEAATKKGQRSCKRKVLALEADMEPTVKTVRVNEVLEPMNASALWRALAARMY